MFSLFVYQNVREETNRSLKRRMDSGNGAAAPEGLMTYDSTWGNFVPALVGSVCCPISYVRPIQGLRDRDRDFCSSIRMFLRLSVHPPVLQALLRLKLPSQA